MNVKLSIGLNDKDTKHQVFDAYTAQNIIYDILQARKVAGITEVMVRIICNDIKLALNQESIMVEYVIASNVMFI